MIPGVGDDAWGQGMMPGVGDNAWGQETRGTRANHHLSHHLSAGTTGRDEVVPHVTAKGEGHRAEFFGGGTSVEDLHAPVQSHSIFPPPQFLKKPMQKPASPPKTRAAAAEAAPWVHRGFSLCPPTHPSPCRLSARPYLAMAMALKLVCPSEMAFWMAVRSAHIPRL